MEEITLYHYCSNASFLSIVRSRSLWASEFSLSNDALEGKWIRKILGECCEDRGLSWFETHEILTQFDQVLSFLGAAGFCLSADGDLLSQWRGYADNGEGVAIGFNVKSLEAIKQPGPGVTGPSPALQKIEERQKAQIDDNVERIIDLWKRGAGRIPTLLGQGTPEEEIARAALTEELRLEFYQLSTEIYAFKNPAFREEREWRLVSIVTPGTHSHIS